METAFVAIYIRKNPIETAKNLLSLTINCSIGDLAALESLVSSMVLKGEISSGTVNFLRNFINVTSENFIGLHIQFVYLMLSTQGGLVL